MTARNEPNWRDTNVLLRSLAHVGASNYLAVGAALSLQGRALLDLPSVRNFYGHRAHNTAQKVIGVGGVIQHYRVPSAPHPTSFCLAYETGRPRSIMSSWLEEINILTDLACN